MTVVRVVMPLCYNSALLNLEGARVAGIPSITLSRTSEGHITESQSTRQSKEYRDCANSDATRSCRVATETETCHFGRCPYAAALLALATGNTCSPVAQLRAGPALHLNCR